MTKVQVVLFKQPDGTVSMHRKDRPDVQLEPFRSEGVARAWLAANAAVQVAWGADRAIDGAYEIEAEEEEGA